MHTWQLQEAKAKLSQLLKLCKIEGPQEISVHGIKTAVLISQQDYEKLTSKSLPKKDFVSFMRSSPLYKSDIKFERNISSMRDIEL